MRNTLSVVAATILQKRLVSEWTGESAGPLHPTG
jgi:hypothetical protein